MGKETISRKTFAKGVTAGVIAAASLGILTIGEYTPDVSPSEETAASAPVSETDGITEGQAEASAPADLSGCTPGIYTASAQGISSAVTVTATFDETGITALSADVSGETPDIGGLIGDEMIEKALSAQSADIDGVSGATITSDAFKAALSDCIAQATGGAAEEAEPESEAPETEGTEAAEEAENLTEDAEETESATEEAALEDETEYTAEEAESLDVAETAALADETETGSEEEAVPASVQVSGGAYTPGVYTASAAGLSSDVSVFAVFDETGFTSLSVDVSGETPDIGGLIGDEMIEKALNAQSADIDGVSGATITSDAFKSALAACIDTASGSTGSAGPEAGAEPETEAESEAESEAEPEAETESETEPETETESETEPETEANEETESETE